MITSRLHTAARLLMATVSVAAVAVALVAAPAAGAAGLRNCVEITGPQSGIAGCYENVWADGTQYRMTFSNSRFTGNTPADIDPFYVLAAQTDAPQGWPPNTFAHDHVVRAVPGQGGAPSTVRMQGYFVLCTAQGLGTGACVPVWTPLGGNPTPLAKTVNGQPLTSTAAIESAAANGDLFLLNLGPNAVLVGAVTRSH